jgi:hypothetical protein
MASGISDNGRKLIAQGTITWDGAGTYKVLLVDDTYSFSAAHSTVADVVAKEIDSTAHPTYSRKTLANRSVAIASNRAQCKADCPIWSLLDAGTLGGAWIYKDGASDAARSLICFLDPADLITSGVDVTLQFGGNTTNGPVYQV